jgi:hypothetical protein
MEFLNDRKASLLRNILLKVLQITLDLFNFSKHFKLSFIVFKF